MMPDLHTHIARYYVMMHAKEAAITRYYSFEWGVVNNLGVDLLVWVVAHWLPVERAAAIVVGLIPPLSVIGIYALSKSALGRIPSTGILAICLIWTFPFSYGFVNFSLGVALAFISGAGWLKLADRPYGRTIYSMVVGVILWVCHLSALGIFIVLVAGCSVVEAHRSGTSLRAQFGRVLASVAAPSLALMLHLLKNGDSSPLALEMHWALKSKTFWIADIFRSSDKVFDRACAAIIYALLAICMIRLLLSKKGLHAGLLLAGLALLSLFFIIPSTVMGSYYADLRLLPAAIVFLLLSAGPISPKLAHAVALSGLVLFSTRLAVTTINWHKRADRAEEDLRALDFVPMGSRIAVLSYNNACAQFQLIGDDHFPSLAIVRRAAFVNTTWNIAGASLMRPVYNLDRDFNSNESTIIRFGEKPVCGEIRVEDRLAVLPRDRFDFVWVFRQRFYERGLPWLTPRYRGPSGTLFAIRKGNPS